MAKTKQKLKPKTDGAIRREQALIYKELDRDDLPRPMRAELLGASQALAWARGENACSPFGVAKASEKFHRDSQRQQLVEALDRFRAFLTQKG